MIDSAVFIGQPIKFGTICTIYPPKVKDVIMNPQLLQLFKLLTYSQEDIEDLFVELKQKNSEFSDNIPTPLEFILINTYQSDEFKTLINKAFEAFIHEPVTFVYTNKSILIGTLKDLSQERDLHAYRLLTEDNFFDFQNMIRYSFGVEAVTLPEEDDNPIVKRVKAAARRRKRLAAKKKNKHGISLTTSLGAICCMGIGLTPLNIGEISYASIDVLMSLYQQKEKYQTDIDSLLAGADPKKIRPKYWIREKSDFHEIKI